MIALSDDTLDRTFAALAHPIRRSILSRLSRGESASVGDLAAPFDVSLMAVSKHVKVMVGAGLIRRQKDGRVQRCSLDPRAMEEARDWIEIHRGHWERQLDSLASYLEGRPDRKRGPETHGEEDR